MTDCKYDTWEKAQHATANACRMVKILSDEEPSLKKDPIGHAAWLPFMQEARLRCIEAHNRSITILIARNKTITDERRSIKNS